MKLPASWQIKRLEKLVQFSSGGTPSKAKPEFWQGDIPWISAATMHQQEIVTSELHISEDGLKAGSKLAKENNLLLLVRGSMLWKKVPICICKRDVAFNQDVKALRINGKVTPTYLLYWFLAHQRFLLNKVVGTGIGAGKFDLDELKSLDILLPPLPEQKAIADLLSTWDEAIEKTERLIQAKERRFRWLLRSLISDQCSMNNEKAEWEKAKLGDVCEVITSNVDKKTLPDEIPVHLCNYMDVYKNFYITNDLDFMTASATAGEIEKYQLRIHDVLLTKDSETPDDIANSACVLDAPVNLLCGYHLAILRPKKRLFGPYLNFALHTPRIRYEFSRQANGATRFGLTMSAYIMVELPLPSINKQKSIAEALTASQQEIDLLKQLADKYKTQKRGLMQKMLTGEWRVKSVIIDQFSEVSE